MDPSQLKVPGLIKLNKGLPQTEKLKKLKESNLDKNVLVIINNLMSETKGNTVANLFSKDTHHLDRSVVYIMQNFFHQN